jgi:leader peptidase (prepilin peptidase)/N-methyltransferase
MLIFHATIILILGLCFVSFINMASYRFGSENISVRDFIFRNSFCPNCNNGLKFKHLFPLFSWIFFKGKCGFCAAKISARYPLIEALTASLFLAIFFILGAKIDIKTILILLMAVDVLIMVVVDLEHYFIPDFTQIILAILIALYHLLVPSKFSFLHYYFSSVGFFIFGIVVSYGFALVTKKQGIGGDDIKFFALAGFMLGIDQMTVFMMLSGFFGVVFGLIWTRLKKDETLPFAPSIVASFLICSLLKIDYVEWLGMLLYLYQTKIG